MFPIALYQDSVMVKRLTSIKERGRWFESNHRAKRGVAHVEERENKLS